MQLRNTFIFIIDNLQYYLQVNVLESQYTIMKNKIKSTRNFEDVQQAHAVFLANVLSQMFVSDGDTEKQNPVRKTIFGDVELEYNNFVILRWLNC